MDRARTTGYSGYHPISIADIQAYLAMIKEDSVEGRLKFLTHIQDMDRTFLKQAAKAAESNK